MNGVHSSEEHDRMKRDSVWPSLAHVGEWHLEADKDGPTIHLELRNCACGSTLAKPIAKEA